MLKILTVLFLTAIITSNSLSNNLSLETLMEIMCDKNSTSRQWCVKVKEEGKETWQLWDKVYQDGNVSKVLNFNDVNWLLAMERPKQEKLRILEHALTIPDVFNSINSTHLLQFWNAETENDKQRFFSRVADVTGKKLNQFIQKKGGGIQLKDDLIRHANSLLFTMDLYYSNLIGGILNGIGRSSFGKFQESAIKVSNSWFRFSSGNLSYVFIPLNMISNSVCLFNPHFNRASDITAKMSIELANIDDLSPEKRGIIAFNTSEQISLTYFAIKFEDIVPRSYEYFSKEVPHENRFFNSPELWQDFKSFYMKGLAFEKLILLQPWFAELDKIATQIESISE